jgi:predicted HicB family RNase H-like nuclease
VKPGSLYDTISPLIVMLLLDTLRGVPKKKPRTDKIPRTVYLSPKISRRLNVAAKAEGMSNSIYIEQTLRARFEKNGIK